MYLSITESSNCDSSYCLLIFVVNMAGQSFHLISHPLNVKVMAHTLGVCGMYHP